MKKGIEFLCLPPPEDEPWALAIRQIQRDAAAERRQRKALRKLKKALAEIGCLKKAKGK